MPTDHPTLWRRVQRGWPASYPLVQFPNPPLIVAIVASLLSGAFSGDAADVLTAASRMGIVVWAYLELVDGDNAFRRLAGVGGLVLMAVRIAGVGG